MENKIESHVHIYLQVGSSALAPIECQVKGNTRPLEWSQLNGCGAQVMLQKAVSTIVKQSLEQLIKRNFLGVL